MRVRPAKFGDIPRLMEIERQSPSAAHWREREYRALFPEACGDESSQPRRICLVAETEIRLSRHLWWRFAWARSGRSRT